MLARFRHAHFIGLGGIGMSGVAEILLAWGYGVSGSDLTPSPVLDRLAALGARVHVGHDAAHLGDADVVVRSSAIRPDNPELREAGRSGLTVIRRAQMLAELMRDKHGVAVTGMHGKTTTTTMIAAVLGAGGLDPTVVVGGRVEAWGTSVRVGGSDVLVAEADESDRSFLDLWPVHAVVTNIDREHMDCYRDMGDVARSFRAFMDHVPFYGAVVVATDDPTLRSLARAGSARVVTCGQADDSDLRISDPRPSVEGGVPPH